MKDTELIFRWIEKGKEMQQFYDRKAVCAVFQGLVEGFSGDNEISKELLVKLSEADEVFINKDHNGTQDVPIITIRIGDNMSLVKIIRYHKIVWSILDKYCSK